MLLTGSLYAAAQGGAKAPKFEFIGGITKNYGTVVEQSRTTQVYKFKNVGKSPRRAKYVPRLPWA